MQIKTSEHGSYWIEKPDGTRVKAVKDKETRQYPENAFRLDLADVVSETLGEVSAAFKTGELITDIADSVEAMFKSPLPRSGWSVWNRMYTIGMQDPRSNWWRVGREVPKEIWEHPKGAIAQPTGFISWEEEDEDGKVTKHSRPRGYKALAVYPFEDTVLKTGGTDKQNAKNLKLWLAEEKRLSKWEEESTGWMQSLPLIDVLPAWGYELVADDIRGSGAYGYHIRADQGDNGLIVVGLGGETGVRTLFHELGHAAHFISDRKGFEVATKEEKEAVAEIIAATLQLALELDYEHRLGVSWNYIQRQTDGDADKAHALVMKILNVADKAMQKIVQQAIMLEKGFETVEEYKTWKFHNDKLLRG